MTSSARRTGQGRGLLRVVIGTARAGVVVPMSRAVKCPDGTPGKIVDVARDWRGVSTYCVVSSDTHDVYFLDAVRLLRAQK